MVKARHWSDITVSSNDEQTPLNSASSNGHIEVVKLLLEKSADVAVASNDGWTPLNSASNSGHVEVVKLLLKRGASVAVANNNGWTPLNSASDMTRQLVRGEVLETTLAFLLSWLFQWPFRTIMHCTSRYLACTLRLSSRLSTHIQGRSSSLSFSLPHFAWKMGPFCIGGNVRGCQSCSCVSGPRLAYQIIALSPDNYQATIRISLIIGR